jgi:hypothetical protein
VSKLDITGLPRYVLNTNGMATLHYNMVNYKGLPNQGLKTAKCKTLATRRKLPQTKGAVPVRCLEQ